MTLRAHGSSFALHIVLASSFVVAVMVALQTMAPR